MESAADEMEEIIPACRLEITGGFLNQGNKRQQFLQHIWDLTPSDRRSRRSHDIYLHHQTSGWKMFCFYILKGQFTLTSAPTEGCRLPSAHYALQILTTTVASDLRAVSSLHSTCLLCGFSAALPKEPDPDVSHTQQVVEQFKGFTFSALARNTIRCSSAKSSRI